MKKYLGKTRVADDFNYVEFYLRFATQEHRDIPGFYTIFTKVMESVLTDGWDGMEHHTAVGVAEIILARIKDELNDHYAEKYLGYIYTHFCFQEE